MDNRISCRCISCSSSMAMVMRASDVRLYHVHSCNTVVNNSDIYIIKETWEDF